MNMRNQVRSIQWSHISVDAEAVVLAVNSLNATLRKLTFLYETKLKEEGVRSEYLDGKSDY